MCPSFGARTRSIQGLLTFERCCGFRKENVLDCTAYIKLIHIGGSSSTKKVSCYAAAIGRGGWTDDVTWNAGAASGRYQMVGWADVRTAVGTYRGAGNASYTGTIES